MGKRYTREEIDRIQALAREGMTSTEIAARLGRTEHAIRNLRHRLNIKTETANTIQSLLSEKDRLEGELTTLKRTHRELSAEISDLQKRRDTIQRALHTDQATLTKRISTALTELKTQKPKLFYITGEEQLAQLTGALIGSFIRWLLE